MLGVCGPLVLLIVGRGSFWKGLRLLVNQSMSWLTWSNWGGRLDLGCRIDVNVAEASESVLRGDVLKYIVLCLKKTEKEAWYLTSSARARLPATQTQCKYPSMFTNARQNTLTHAPCHQKRLAMTNVANDSAQGGYKREESSRNRKGNEKDWAESPRRSSTKNIRIR